MPYLVTKARDEILKKIRNYPCSHSPSIVGGLRKWWHRESLAIESHNNTTNATVISATNKVLKNSKYMRDTGNV